MTWPSSECVSVRVICMEQTKWERLVGVCKYYQHVNSDEDIKINPLLISLIASIDLLNFYSTYHFLAYRLLCSVDLWNSRLPMKIIKNITKFNNLTVWSCSCCGGCRCCNWILIFTSHVPMASNEGKEKHGEAQNDNRAAHVNL